MEKQQYILKLPLKQLALIKIVIGLWQQDDILSSINDVLMTTKHSNDETSMYSSMGDWADKIIVKVTEKVPELLLLDSLKEDLMHLIPPIGSEILRWVLHNQFLISTNAADVLDQICWTPQGTVDYRETAVRLIRQERVDIVSSYELACLYCLDDSIQAIWEKLSEKDKERFFSKGSIGSFQKQDKLVTFWTYFRSGNIDFLKNLYNPRAQEVGLGPFQRAFECESIAGNKVAAEYFFQKLTSKEKKFSLLRTAGVVAYKRSNNIYSSRDFPPENFSSVLCYLLSQMSKKKQIKVLKNDTGGILRSCFLDWPWQHLFMKLTELLWPFLSVDDYQRMLKGLSSNSSISVLNCNRLFREFFLQSPSHFRNSCLDMESNINWVSNLFIEHEKENMQFILRNLDTAVKARFASSPFALILWVGLTENEHWAEMEMFLRDCKMSDKAKKKVKSYLRAYFACSENVISKRMKKKLFHLIDNAGICNTKLCKRNGRKRVLYANKKKTLNSKWRRIALSKKRMLKRKSDYYTILAGLMTFCRF